MDMKINVDLSNPYYDEVSRVEYKGSKCNLSFGEDYEQFNITLDPAQFKDLLEQMLDTYVDMYSIKQAKELIENTVEKAVV